MAGRSRDVMRRWSILLVAVPVLGLTIVAGVVPNAAAATATVTPVADAYVMADQPAVNFGTSTGLRVDGSPIANAYLKFDVQGLSATPARATLRVFTNTAGITGVTVSAVADTAWSETGINYNNRPAVGAQLASSGPLTAGSWMSFDVTSLVRGNGLFSFALTAASSSSTSLISRETINKPQLVLDTSAAPPPPAPGDPVVVAGGDVACAPDYRGYNGGQGSPGKCHMKATSDLVLGISPAKVLELGDFQYDDGNLAFANASYGPTWGRFKSITQPAVGNHEYGTGGAGGYFSYFGNAATPLQPGCVKNCDGWYSFDIGSWHVVMLNSECTRISGGAGCAAGSPQQRWLDADLATHPALCTAVIEHRPRWSSNSFASPDVQPLINTMYARKVDLLLTGHAHSYERFAPQNAAGARDDAAGIREIIAGTGGSFFTGFGTVAANSEVHKSKVFGVLKLTLHPSSYDWAFIADPSTPFADWGTGTCH